MKRACSSGGTCVEPLNIMCSNMWAMPRLPARLVLAAGVIEDLHRHDRRLVLGHEDDLEPVGQLPLLDLRRALVGFRRLGVAATAVDAAAISSAARIMLRMRPPRFGQYVYRNPI